MKHEYPIPILNQDSWNEIQAHLERIGKILSSLKETEDLELKNKLLEEADICLGMLDVFLGRYIPMKQAMEELKKERKWKQF